jgi:hypothetical protein
LLCSVKNRNFFVARAPSPAKPAQSGVMLNGFSREASRVHHHPAAIRERDRSIACF